MPRATLFFPKTARDLKSGAALNPELLADLIAGFETVACTVRAHTVTDAETGEAWRTYVCAYEVAPTDTPRLASRLDRIGARYAARMGAPSAMVLDVEGLAYEVSEAEPQAFMSKREREAWDIAA